MVAEIRSEILSGFIYGITMLLIVSVNGSNSTNKSRYILQQIINKNNEMLSDAKILFNKSFAEHEISEKDCNQTLEWFMKPNISNAIPLPKLLKEVDRNLNRFHKVFKDLKNQHTDEHTHTKKITQALSSIEAQRQNIQTYSEKENGVNETGPAIPDRDIYQKKLDCCILSNIYMQFLKGVKKILRKETNYIGLVYKH